MYFFTGNNLFGQWDPSRRNVIDQLSMLPSTAIKELNSEFNARDVVLIHLGWSHNIFKVNNEYFILGDYKCIGKYIEIIKIPQEGGSILNVTVLSNDHHILIFNKETREYWLLSLDTKDIRKMNLEVQVSLNTDRKRLRYNDHILKCAIFNESIKFLTSYGTVYCGMLPNVVDTTHCDGEPTDIQCGNEHYMLLTSSGALYTWGNGRRLQLGHGDVNTLEVPTEVEALAGIKIIKIAAGGWHSLALSEFGDLYAWGWNDTGQLGIKNNADNRLVSYSLPTLVDIFDENNVMIDFSAKEIACGAKHSAILLSDNSVWTSGSNKYGQLGFSVDMVKSTDHFKKCGSFTMARDLTCGQWSTVINDTKYYFFYFVILNLFSRL